MLILLILGQDFKKQSIGNQYSSTAAAARSLQSCPTLCDPMDCSPPGSSIYGIFQARVLEWGAIAFFQYSSRLFLMLGSQNRKKESKMGVAKRQGREKPAKTEQRSVKERSEDWSEDLRQDKQHSWLAQLHKAGPWGEGKTYKKRSQRVGALSSLRVFGSACPCTSKMYFPAIF